MRLTHQKQNDTKCWCEYYYADSITAMHGSLTSQDDKQQATMVSQNDRIQHIQSIQHKYKQQYQIE